MKKISSLEMVDISKSFRGVAANDKINLKISSGEILGLLGENGAGKTTLMNILFGLYQPDSGQIRINDEAVRIGSPMDSIRRGIGMVHQHFMLVDNHTVAENIALGYEQVPFLFPQKKIRRDIRGFSKKFKFNIDPDKYIWQLSAGEQQRVEIIKALINGADLLILDEPTSVLTPQESVDLFRILRQMTAEGHMVILISHKLDEIMDLCSRVLVLQKGKLVGQADTKDVDKAKLARMMIGRDLSPPPARERLPRETEALRVSDLVVKGDKGLDAVRDISFSVYQNEIFGIAGVSGNGQRELVEAITGLREANAGEITINGSDITNQDARCIYNSGVSHVPEERIKFGIAPGLCVFENAILKQHHNEDFSSRKMLAFKKIKAHADTLTDQFKVDTPSVHTPTKNLSGGNIQKLILGREIHQNPSLLVASHPTYGLDVGAAEYLHQQLLAQRARGGAVLLVSEDLEEVLQLSDRIGVMFAGKLMGILEADDPRLEKIGLMMAGSVRFETDGFETDRSETDGVAP